MGGADLCANGRPHCSEKFSVPRRAEAAPVGEHRGVRAHQPVRVVVQPVIAWHAGMWDCGRVVAELSDLKAAQQHERGHARSMSQHCGMCDVRYTNCMGDGAVLYTTVLTQSCRDVCATS